VHDSTIVTATDKMGSGLASAKLGNFPSKGAGNFQTTGICSVSSIGFTEHTSSTGGSVSARNELGVALEVYKLSIMDSISCSTDLDEVDPGVRNILHDLLEEP